MIVVLAHNQGVTLGTTTHGYSLDSGVKIQFDENGIEPVSIDMFTINIRIVKGSINREIARKAGERVAGATVVSVSNRFVKLMPSADIGRNDWTAVRAIVESFARELKQVLTVQRRAEAKKAEGASRHHHNGEMRKSKSR